MPANHTPSESLNLRPEEQLISVEEIPTVTPNQPLSCLDALQILAGVKKPEEIGKRGPLITAHAFPENTDQPALRRYEAIFGRDSLITSYFLLDAFPLLARGTLIKLAELQGVNHSEASEEEPGEIVHEARLADDPVAQVLTQTRGWQWPYYGSTDATPLFVIVLEEYVRRTSHDFLNEKYQDRKGQMQTMAYALKQAAEWILKKTTSNPQGLLESVWSTQPGSPRNQVWKDSEDSYHHADGSLANYEAGVASIEVQAYAYDALLGARKLLDPAQHATLIENCHTQASKLRAAMHEIFWIEDSQGAYFALGSDRNKQGTPRSLQVRTSNMGHLLNSKILEGNDTVSVQQREAIVQELFAPTLLDPSGIRTLATHENRFRPASYHNGSVWPWDTYYIALGLRRQGYNKEADDLCQRIKHVVATTRRFPEFVSGTNTSTPTFPNRIVKVYDTRYKFEHNIEEPPQEIQAWTVAAAVAIDF